MQVFIHSLSTEFHSNLYFSLISTISATFKDVRVSKASIYTNLGAQLF